MSVKTKVFIAEDHKMLREGLKAILEERESLDIVGEAQDGLEAIRKIKRLQPDLVLLDLSMPKMNGLSVLLDVKDYLPDIRVLVLTIHESEAYVREIFEAGADGYCSKHGSREELLVAIDAIMEGHVYLSPAIAERVLKGFLARGRNAGTQDAWNSLTQREKEILKLLSEGYSNKEISELLFISVKTVEKHRANIMNKLNLHNVPNLTSFAIEKGLVEGKKS